MEAKKIENNESMATIKNIADKLTTDSKVILLNIHKDKIETIAMNVSIRDLAAAGEILIENASRLYEQDAETKLVN